jgi:hypothetical protein
LEYYDANNLSELLSYTTLSPDTVMYMIVDLFHTLQGFKVRRSYIAVKQSEDDAKIIILEQKPLDTSDKHESSPNGRAIVRNSATSNSTAKTLAAKDFDPKKSATNHHTIKDKTTKDRTPKKSSAVKTSDAKEPVESSNSKLHSDIEHKILQGASSEIITKDSMMLQMLSNTMQYKRGDGDDVSIFMDLKRCAGTADPTVFSEIMEGLHQESQITSASPMSTSESPTRSFTNSRSNKLASNKSAPPPSSYNMVNHGDGFNGLFANGYENMYDSILRSFDDDLSKKINGDYIAKSPNENDTMLTMSIAVALAKQISEYSTSYNTTSKLLEISAQINSFLSELICYADGMGYGKDSNIEDDGDSGK